MINFLRGITVVLNNNSSLLNFLLKLAPMCMFLIWSSIALAQSEVKIAVIDLEHVVTNSPGGKRLQAQLESFQQQAQNHGNAMSQKAIGMRQQLTNSGSNLSELQRNELQRQLEELAVEMNRFRDDKQHEGQKMQQEGLRQIEQQLEPVFKQFKDENGYDLMLNNVPSVVILASDKVNVTDQFMQLLNEQ